EEVLAQAKAEGWTAPATVPEWTNRIKLSGDVRLRHQDVEQSSNNAAYLSVQDTNTGGTPIFLNTTDNIHEDKLRLRLAVEASVADSVSVGARFVTGTTTNPVSSNQTLGRGFNKSAVLFDRAWLSYQPFAGLTLTAGRMANPWFSTDLIWYEDLSF